MTRPYLVGKSAAHCRIISIIGRVAPTDAEVLISGPTGVGKELYARYLHDCSSRREARFVAINCGALPSDLFENELFGHIGGAFTGARPNSEGLVMEAENGTLFLDEVDSLSLPCQVKLLRFIQEKEYRRLGETKLRRANIRVVAATNTNLYDACQNGHFREDLFFRLRVVPVEVPPLNQRQEDILLLLELFIAHCAETYHLPRIELSQKAVTFLFEYPWPGNVRELENCVKCLTCLQLSAPVKVKDLPLLNKDKPSPVIEPAADSSISDRSLKEAKQALVDNFERNYLEKALQLSDGNITAAAHASGKTRRVFFELMRKYDIKAEEFRVKSASINDTSGGLQL